MSGAGRQAWPALSLALAALVSVAAVEARGVPDFSVLAEDNAAAVVNISTVRKPAPRTGDDESPEVPPDVPWPEFFEKFFERHAPFPAPRPPTSVGSGFIITDDGYVITNHHVVDGVEEITVKLSDRRELPAELIGTDELSDIALLKVEADDLPAVRIGSSDAIKVGQWVLAIGAPFGFEHSVTAGIVSAKGRRLPSGNYVPFIQTDVAINPGNSGGPLFNLDGEVIGVNSQIYSRTGSYSGLSFAVPISLAMVVVGQLRDTGQVSRGWLGRVHPGGYAGSVRVVRPRQAARSADRARRRGRPGATGRLARRRHRAAFRRRGHRFVLVVAAAGRAHAGG